MHNTYVIPMLITILFLLANFSDNPGRVLAEKWQLSPIVLFQAKGMINNDLIAFSSQSSSTGVQTKVSFLGSFGSDGSDEGQFINPMGFDIDSSGNVYVADNGNRRIQKFDNQSDFMMVINVNSSNDRKPFSPTDLAVDSSGNIYVVNYAIEATANMVEKFSANGTFEMVLDSHGDNGSYLGTGGIATDSLGNVYVADSSYIQKFDSEGNFVTKWGSEGYGDGQFRQIRGLGIDSLGNVYVADSSNNNIQKFDSEGNFVTKWGSEGYGDGQFIPEDVETDSLGYVFVADRGNDRIQKFDNNGTFIAEWGPSVSGEGNFNNPLGVAVDSWGKVYVLDTGNSRIEVFSLR